MRTTRFNRSLILKSILIVTTTLGMALLSASAISAKPDVPPGKANPVVVYDYHDFGAPSVVEKEFSAFGRFGSYYTVIDKLTYPAEGELLVDRTRSDDGGMLSRHVYHYLLTDTDMLWVRDDSYNSEGDITTTTVFDPALSIRQSVMPQGAVQGGGAVSTSTSATTPDEEKYGVTRFNSALALEDVQVPYGPISGCLRMYEEVNGNSRTSWYCPGVGLTKWVRDNGDVWELKNCIGCPAP